MKNSRLDFGLFIIRFMSGFLLFYIHGLPKLLNAPDFVTLMHSISPFLSTAFAWFIIIAETLFALLFAIGLFTRFSAILLTLTFLGIMYYHIQIAGNPLSSYEKTLLYFSIFLAFSLIGPTGYSLDRYIFKK